MSFAARSKSGLQTTSSGVIGRSMEAAAIAEGEWMVWPLLCPPVQGYLYTNTPISSGESPAISTSELSVSMS